MLQTNYTEDADTNENYNAIISDILDGNFDKLSISLSDWQKSQLYNISDKGVRCLLHNWFSVETKLDNGTYCNSTWDNIYCWPPAPSGSIVTRTCYEILKETEEYNSPITGSAHRVCLDNGTWLWGSWTNYTECIASLEENDNEDKDMGLVVAVRYILFIGSILSFLCLATSLFIFYYFKCLRSDRVTVHIHLMVALILRCILLVVITEPFIFNRSYHYREIDFVCKAVLSINLYATVASINWMFIQGHYLHSKLTTNVFDRGTPFKVYYSIGWVLPLILIAAWATSMETQHPVKCWKNYSDLPYIWILLGPMIFALLINLLFLVNIMRILLTKIQRANPSTDTEQFRRAVKATAILFPLLGINNLLFLYNPGGHYKKVFIILNTFFQSSQGLFVSILYCFISSDVREAIRREYRRFVTRRTAVKATRTYSRKNKSSFYTHAGGGASTVTQCASFRTKTDHVKRNQLNQTEQLDTQQSRSPSQDIFVDVPQLKTNFNSPSSSPIDPSHPNHNKLDLDTISHEQESSHIISIPMKEMKAKD